MAADLAVDPYLERVHRLEAELERVRRERDQLRVQVDALSAALQARGAHSESGVRSVASLGDDLWGDGAAAPQGEPGARFAARPSASTIGEDRADFDLSKLKQLKAEELDALPYGLVVLDSDGNVVTYNDTESRLARLPRARVVGKNFFREVAPCTRVREFEGRFRDFVLSPRSKMFEEFDFVFRFAHSTQHVTIYLTAGRVAGTVNVAMVRRLIRQ